MEEKTVNESKVEEKASETGLSHSKQKRQEREKKAKALKRDALISNVIWVVIGILIVAAIATLIITRVVAKSKEVVASDAFGEELEDNGFIKGVNANDYITLFDYKNLTIPKSEVTYTDDEMNEDISNVLESHKSLDTETTAAIADGDTVNIDYVGSIDGVEFEGGNSNGEGSDLQIGSGTFVDDFEQQLIGAKVGEIINVNVDFPEDYSSEDLAGQNADFVVTINGIYVTPELTDDFVAENLSAYATTVDEYKAYLKESNEADKLTNYIETYISDNTVVNKYPKSYLKNLKATTRYTDEQSYEYMNQMYMQYYGAGFSSFEEYMGMTEEEYLEDLDTRAKEDLKTKLAYQAILEDEGISITEDEVKEYVVETYGSEDSFDTITEQYGIGYLANEMIPDKAMDVLKEYATIQ